MGLPKPWKTTSAASRIITNCIHNTVLTAINSMKWWRNLKLMKTLLTSITFIWRQTFLKNWIKNITPQKILKQVWSPIFKFWIPRERYCLIIYNKLKSTMCSLFKATCGIFKVYPKLSLIKAKMSFVMSVEAANKSNKLMEIYSKIRSKGLMTNMEKYMWTKMSCSKIWKSYSRIKMKIST